eukprot:TRINITY_DN9958_c0_g1_i3.p1 TRINITY_DN9958_c0_g1~~TRINITY_DN9958_c0_g1_i3.p1  ORF type:complete len:212 (+),score=32.41 TRINITY_DN9958_c0_g1_i3:47-682(+)
METLIGIACDDHVIIAASATACHSIIQIQHTEDKLHELDSHKVLGCVGEAGDRVNFCEYIHRNLQLNANRQNRTSTAKSTAHFIRSELATAIRSNPVAINPLFAAYDGPLPELAKLNAEKKENNPDGSGAYLWYLDHLGTMQRVPYATQGHAGTFATAVCDRYHKPDLTQEQSIHLMKQCIAEVQKRIVINNPKFIVKIVDKNGVRLVNVD